MAGEVSEMDRETARRVMEEGCHDLWEGRYDVGWAKYEYRFPAGGGERDLPQRRWRGEPLAGRSILIHREQGLGDEIMFASCFPDVLAAAERCTISCEARLASLFRRSFPGTDLRPSASGGGDWKDFRGEAFDYQIAAGSLGRYLRAERSHFPEEPGFLVPDAAAVERWRARLDRLGPGPAVGISWQGGADLLSLRQAPWETWRRILEDAGARFVNLQYGHVADALQTIGEAWDVTVHAFEDLDPLNDVDALAALAAALDLVVTVPNTTAHVAAAVGAETRVLLHPDWGCFWLRQGLDSPWYPSLRVLRRDRKARWRPAVEALRAELAELARAGLSAPSARSRPRP